jgi:hypothetical protein
VHAELHHVVVRRAVQAVHVGQRALAVAVPQPAEQDVAKVHQRKRKALVATRLKGVKPFASC